MALGRLLHYTFDAVLLSTVAAGVRKSTGFRSASPCTVSTTRTLLSPDVNALPEGIARSSAQSFLGVGESIFDMITATAMNSNWFRKDARGRR